MNTKHKINKYKTKLNMARDYKKIEIYRKKLMMYGGGGESSNGSEQSEDTIPLVKIINLDLSENDNKVIDKINIEDHNNTTLYYDKNTISTQIKEFIKGMGNNKEILEDLTKIIIRIIKRIIKEQDEESAIVWLRSNEYLKADPKFRWHRDGSYFKPNTKKPIYKFAVSLKGENTPVVTDEKAIERFDKIQKEKYKVDDSLADLANSMNLSYPIDVMIELDKFIAPALIEAIGDKYIQAEYGQGAYFLNRADDSDGRPIKGTIHSEPEIQKDRLFLAILPGPEDKCKTWVEKQKR